VTAALATSGPRRRTRFWASFAVPGVGWLIAFFVVSVYAVMAVAFGTVDPVLRTAVPAWNPLQWDFGAMSDVLDRVFGGDLGVVFVRTFKFVALSLAGCILIGYPVAYYVARKAGRRRGLLLVLLVLPFWISYLMRMLGDYYTNDILSRSPRTEMIGNQIDFFLNQSSQKTKGATLVLLLSVLLAIAMSWYLASIARARRETST